MSRLLVALTAPALLLMLAPAAPVPRDAEPVLYFPTKVGAKWVYGGPHEDLTRAVTEVEDKNGRKLVTVVEVGPDGQSVSHEKCEVSGHGVAVVETSKVKLLHTPGGRGPSVEVEIVSLKTPLWLLKLPAQPGRKWDGRMPDDIRWAVTTGQPERVKVPAGEFDVLPVEMVSVRPGGEPETFRIYYAAGIGPVKWTVGTEVEHALKSFTPGKD